MNKSPSISVLIGLTAFFLATSNAEVHDGKSFAIEKAVPVLEGKPPFTIRENWWKGQLESGKNKIIKHQLFVRNEYWFWLGASLRDAKVSVHIYDGEGKIADAEAFQDKNVAGVRVVPKKSGVYYVRVAIEESSVSPVEWALIYAYQ